MTRSNDLNPRPRPVDPVSTQDGRGAHRVAELATLSFLLGFSIVAFGAVHGWASGILEIGLAFLLLARVLWGRDSNAADEARAPWRSLTMAAVLMLGFLVFQCVPQPLSLLGVTSPGTRDFYRQTIEVLSSIAPNPLAGEASTSDALPISLHPFATRAAILLYLAYGAAFALAASAPRPRALIQLSTAAVVASAVLALVQYATWNGYVLWFFEPYDAGVRPGFDRLTGPYVNADHFGGLMALVLPIGGALFARVTRHHHGRDLGEVFLPAMLLALGIAIAAGALLATASRGAILGATVGLTVLGWGLAGRESEPEAVVSPPRHRPPRIVRRLAFAATGLVIVMVAFLYVGPKGRVELDRRLAQTLTDPDLDMRQTLWRQSAPILSDFPLFGIGVGAWEDVFRRHQRFPMVGWRIEHAHNDHLEWLEEVGWVGFFLTGLLALSIGSLILRNDRLPKELAWGVAGSLVAVSLHEFFDFVLRVPANGLFVAILLGCAVNRNWPLRRRASRADEGQPAARAAATRSISWGRTFAPIAVGLVLAAGGFGQIAEFGQWAKIRSGATDLYFTPSDPRSWYELGTRLSPPGTRPGPVAERCFRRAIEGRPGFEAAYWRLAPAPRDPLARIRILDAAIYLSPTAASRRLARAALLDFTGDGGEALAEVERAAFFAPRFVDHGYLPVEPRKPEPLVTAAVRGLERALEERPADPDLMNQVAFLYWRLGRWLESAEIWERAAETSGDWAFSGVQAGLAFGRARLFDRADSVIRKAIADAPQAARGYLNLALAVYVPQKRYVEAEEVLKSGLTRVGGDSVRLYRALYAVRFEAGEVRGAIEALAKAAALSPRDANLQSHLGVAYLNAKDYLRARLAFERTLAIDPTRAADHHLLGMAFERGYDLRGARAAYSKATSLAPENSLYREALRRVTEEKEDVFSLPPRRLKRPPA